MALWQVIYKIPGYVGSVKNVFTGLVDQITSVSGYTDRSRALSQTIR